MNVNDRQWKVLALNPSLKDVVGFGETTFEEIRGFIEQLGHEILMNVLGRIYIRGI